MSAFPGVSSYQSSSLGSKFVVIGVVCCQEMRRYALFHKVLRGLAKYLAELYPNIGPVGGRRLFPVAKAGVCIFYCGQDGEHCLSEGASGGYSI